MKNASLALLITTFSTLSFAADVWHTSTIRSVYPLANGSFVLTFTTETENCTNGNKPRYFYVGQGLNGVTADGANKIYSLALAAASQKLPLVIAFDNSTSDCAINRASVQFSN